MHRSHLGRMRRLPIWLALLGLVVALLPLGGAPRPAGAQATDPQRWFSIPEWRATVRFRMHQDRPLLGGGRQTLDASCTVTGKMHLDPFGTDFMINFRFLTPGEATYSASYNYLETSTDYRETISGSITDEPITHNIFHVQGTPAAGTYVVAGGGCSVPVLRVVTTATGTTSEEDTRTVDGTSTFPGETGEIQRLPIDANTLAGTLSETHTPEITVTSSWRLAPASAPLGAKVNPATACPNEAVTFTATGGTGALAWSGGGNPATGDGRTFLTRFPTPGRHAATVTAANLATASAAVTIHEKSEAAWARRFPDARTTAALEPGFREGVDQFIDAMRDAGARVSISSTYRPVERAWLMHYAWRIAREGLDPAAVPAREGIDICWVHRTADGRVDRRASRAGAEQMVRAYRMVRRAALESRHTERRAIDMTISWEGTLTIRSADGTPVRITGGPRNGDHPRLQQVGRSYDVIHFRGPGDTPHWSTDGR